MLNPEDKQRALDPWIIDEIKRREEEQRKRDDANQPRKIIDRPPRPSGQDSNKPQNEKRGVDTFKITGDSGRDARDKFGTDEFTSDI